MDRSRSLYVDLLKSALRGELAVKGERARRLISVEQCAELIARANKTFEERLDGRSIEDFIGSRFLNAEASGRFGAEHLAQFLNHMHRDLSPDTMSDRANLDCVQFCVESVIQSGVPGDLIEAGVWKGGIPILMRGLLEAHGVSDRNVWAVDSFEGLPEPDPDASLEDAIWYEFAAPLDRLKIPLSFVEDRFRAYDLWDDQVRLLKGWFSDVLPSADITSLSVIRLDGDWYESTRCALEILYPKLSPGGFIIIDDYGLPLGCRRAVDEYRSQNGITEPFVTINEQSVFWQNERAA
jgi:hypothetical protein